MLKIPSLCDIHTHGCMGYDFATATAEQMAVMADFYAKNGIMTVLPTLTALREADYERQITALLPFIEDENCPFAGINLEGPFLAPSKKGAINGDLLQEIDLPLIHRLWEISRGTIKIVTAAPELSGFDELCNFAQGKFIVSVGHTAADAKTAHNAFAKGASHVTHLFNAMNGLHHREPNLVGAALASSVTKEIICDGVHLDETLVRMLFKGFADEIVMISDSMAAAGLNDGVYQLSGQPVYVRNGRATLENGTIAGSCMSLLDHVKTALRWGISVDKIIHSASTLPYKILGLENKHTITSDENYNIISVDKK